VAPCGFQVTPQGETQLNADNDKKNSSMKMGHDLWYFRGNSTLEEL
jgi:hypothetical protein